MSKLNSGKVSLAVLLTSILLGAFFLGKNLTTVFANGDDQGPQCIATPGQCGTDNGTISTIVKTDKPSTWQCPTDYSDAGHDSSWPKSCRKVTGSTYEYTDYTWTCSTGYHVQNSGNWDQKCHRDNACGRWDWWNCPPEHKSPTSTSCPGDYTKIGDGSSTQCRKSVPTYDYKNKVEVFGSCPVGSTQDPNHSDKCLTTVTQGCQTGTKLYDSCTPKEDCPTACGYAGGTVPDGRGGTTQCSANESCEEDQCPANSSPDEEKVCKCNSGYHATDSEVLTCEPDPSTSPTPQPSVTPVPTPNGDVCLNLDGIQTSIPDGYHKDTPDGACNKFEFGGPPPPPPAGGSVLGASTTTGGKVLGASTMAKTGTFEENLYMAIMGLGAIITISGAKNLKKAHKAA